MRNRKSAADQIFTGFISEQCFTVPLRDYPNFRKWEKYFFHRQLWNRGAVFATGGCGAIT